MKKDSFHPHRPKPLTLRQQAHEILKATVTRMPDDGFLQRLLDDPLDTVRELRATEESPLGVVGVAFHLAGYDDADKLRQLVLSKWPGLGPRFGLPAEPALPVPSLSRDDFARLADPPDYTPIIGLIDRLITRLAHADGDDLTKLGEALFRLLRGTENKSGATAVHGPTGYARCSRAFREHARRAYGVLMARLEPKWDAQAGFRLREEALRFALMAFDGHEQELTADEKTRLRSMAALELGAIRASLRGFTEAQTRAEFPRLMRRYESCVPMVFHFGTLGFGLKQLVLLLRDLRAPAVASNLRYWGAGTEQLPPSHVVAVNLVNCAHFYGAREQQADPTLQTARTEFAEFCLSRLELKKGVPKPSGSNHAAPDALLEKSAYWRSCVIFAAEALQVNPQGRGHRLLHQVAAHDPDADVRRTAEEAYTKLRHLAPMPPDESPRRALITAIWWLLQAHLLDLGIPLDDEDGIQATLAFLLRRTTEAQAAHG